MVLSARGSTTQSRWRAPRRVKDVVVERGLVRLSFDLDPGRDNLRYERYYGGLRARSFLSGRLANKLYYLARPFLGVSVRRYLQKLRLRVGGHCVSTLASRSNRRANSRDAAPSLRTGS